MSLFEHEENRTVAELVEQLTPIEQDGDLDTSEFVCTDAFTDEIRNLMLVESKGYNFNQWRWVPATIDEWILGEKYLNLGEVIRASVLEDCVRFFERVEGDVNPWHRKYDEAIFCEGIGSGKSFKTSIISTYFQHLLLCLRSPQRYFHIDESSKIAIMNMSISERNARKVIFSEISSKIKLSKWFQERPWSRDDARCPDPICTSELRFKNNTFIIPGSSSWRTAVGYNIIVGVIDEAGAYRSTDNQDQAEDIYLSLQRRLGSRFENKGAIVVAGSPLYENDFLEGKIMEGEELHNRVLSVRRPLWKAKYNEWEGEFFYVDRVNKRYSTAEEHKNQVKGKDIDKIPAVSFLVKAFNANITKAYRDFGARPSATLDSFFERPRVVLDKINQDRTEDPMNEDGTFKEWFEPLDKRAFHAIHVDLGITGDACGLAMGHLSGYTPEGGCNIYVDCLIRLQGSAKAPVQIAKLREYVYQLKEMGFNIQVVTFDGFQSIDTIQILEKKGYVCKVLSVDRNTIPYYSLKEAINEDRLDYYCVKSHGEKKSASEWFVKECMHLEEIEGRKVDHPPKGTKDVSDAVAGMVHNIVENNSYYGAVSVSIL